MPWTRESGAMLSRSYALPCGPRVRLRLARPSDLPGIRSLLARRGLPATETGLERLVRYDPSRRLVLCALAPLAAGETVAGVAAIELSPGAEPETVVVDEELTDGLGPLMGDVLSHRADMHARHVA
jgi:hypothetical protein